MAQESRQLYKTLLIPPPSGQVMEHGSQAGSDLDLSAIPGHISTFAESYRCGVVFLLYIQNSILGH